GCPLRDPSTLPQDLVEAADTGAPKLAQRHPDLDFAWIDKRLEKRATGIDDHRARVLIVHVTQYRLRIQPFDARLFHVPEVHRVVDVAERVHVGPTDRLQRRVDEQARYRHGWPKAKGK